MDPLTLAVVEARAVLHDAEDRYTASFGLRASGLIGRDAQRAIWDEVLAARRDYAAAGRALQNAADEEGQKDAAAEYERERDERRARAHEDAEYFTAGR